MSFTCYPIIITEVVGQPVPSIESIIADLVDNSEIPIRIITNTNDNLFTEVKKTYGIKDKIHYIIVVVQYINMFNT